MKIYRSVSEKRTFRSVSDEFISREFVAGQEIDIPDNASEDIKRYLELQLTYELRKQVLTGFVLEGMITAEQFAASLAPYEGLLKAAQAAAYPTAEAA